MRQAFPGKCFCCSVTKCGKVKNRRKTKGAQNGKYHASDNPGGYRWLNGTPKSAAGRELIERGSR